MSDSQTDLLLEESNLSGSKRNRRKQVKPRHVDTAGVINRPEDIANSSEMPTDSYTCGKCAEQFYQLPAYFQHKKICSRQWPLLSPEQPDNPDSTSPELNSSGPPSLDNAKLTDNNNQPQFNFEFPPTPAVQLQPDQLYQLQLVQKIYAQMFGGSDSPKLASQQPNATDKTLEFLREQMLSCIETLKNPVEGGLDLSVNSGSKTVGQLGNCSTVSCSSETAMEEDFNCELCDSQFAGSEDLEIHYQTQHKPNREKRPKSYPSWEEAEDRNIDNPNSFYNLLFEANFSRPKSCPPVVTFDADKIVQTVVTTPPEPTSNGRQSDNFAFPSYSPMDLFPNGHFNPYANGIFNPPPTQHFPYGYKPAPAAPHRPNGRQSVCRSRSNADIDDDWESMMEISTTDENEKLQKLVDKLDSRKQLVSDPNQCVICQRILSCKSALQMHYRTHTGERPFKCKICLRAFTTKGNLKTHMGVHRTKPPIRLFHQCPVCHKKFGNAILLHQHIRVHNGPPGNNLLLQPNTSGNSHVPNVNNVVNVNGSKLAYANGFGANFFNDQRFLADCISGTTVLAAPSKVSLKEELSKTPVVSNPPAKLPSPPQLVSTICTTTSLAPTVSLPTSTTTVRRRHSVIDWGGKTVKSEPSEPLETSVAKSQVETKELSSISTSLSIPNSNPFTSVMLPTAQQVAMMSGRPNTTCNICFKTFACNSALEIHYRSHTKERPFKCQVCQRGFSTKGNMKQHLLTHKQSDSNGQQGKSDKKPSASVDGRGDNRSSSPDRRHSGRSGSVPIQFDFRNQSDLSSTQSESPRPQTSVSPDEIREVPVVFQPTMSPRGVLVPNCLAETPIVPPADSILSALSPLESIRKMWDKTEPPAVAKRQPILSKHQCQVCYKHFSSASALQIHMRTHTGDKPFKCDVCERAFTTKGNLKVHMGTHVWNTTASRRGRRNLDSPPTGKPFEVDFNPTKMDRKTGQKASEADYDSVSDDEEIVDKKMLSTIQPLPATAILPQAEMQIGQRRPAQLVPNGIFPHPTHNSYLPGPNPFENFFSPTFPPTFSPFLSPEQLYQQSAAQLNCRPFGPPPPHTIYGGFGHPTNGHFGHNGSDQLESLMLMWRSVCSVCSKVCANPSELESHLKQHLSASKQDRTEAKLVESNRVG